MELMPALSNNRKALKLLQPLQKMKTPMKKFRIKMKSKKKQFQKQMNIQLLKKIRKSQHLL